MGNTILLAVDGSEGSGRALEHAMERAKMSGAEVVVAYVIEWSPYSFNTAEENAERHLRREHEIARAQEMVVDPAIARLEGQGIKCRGAVAHGSPAETVLKLASKHDAVQIVLGRIGSTGLKSMIFGSLAGALIQTAPIPVMVVP